MSALLQVTDLRVAYGGIQAVKGVSFQVNEGELVSLIGSNGAGKTTTMKGITGSLLPTAGRIEYLGRDIRGQGSWDLVKQGLVMVPEGRGVFTRMSILENLQMGAYLRRDKAGIQTDIERVFHLFPRLQERSLQLAGTLSGGEQQMVAIGRALMSQPRVLLLDEPFLGLAPMVVEEIRHALNILRQDGMTMILVEQKLDIALPFTSRTHVMIKGQLALVQDSAQVMESPDLAQLYFRLSQPLS